MDRVLKVEGFDQFGNIGRVRVYIVTVCRLGQASVTTTIMRDHAIAVLQEEVVGQFDDPLPEKNSI